MTAQPALLADLGPRRIAAPIVRRPNSFYHRRHLYPCEWSTLARELKELCGWRCTYCDRPCQRPDDPATAHLPVLTCAHTWPPDHAPDAPVVSLAMLCARCHLAFDAERRHAPSGRMTYGWVQLDLFGAD
jgi:hypothetical protein